ncbi:MAG: cytochrome-c peroxidase [Acidobacteriia bacterium]|nr:cytochrome-c peroxidase [Terriglobia bacterium]
MLCHWVRLAAVLWVAAQVFGQSDVPIRARSYRNIAPSTGAAIPIGRRVEVSVPLGLPPVRFPEDNPPTAETIALGRKLFFDGILSRDGKVSCASCHDPQVAFSDPRTVSIGVDGLAGTRQGMVIVNATHSFAQFWDGRALTLEQQAEGPVQNPIEMAHSLAGVERKLAADARYVELFGEAFSPGRITFEMVAKSLATYERMLVSGNSAFDRYYYGGDKTAMNESAIRGLKFFLDNTLDGPNCVSCHRIEPAYATFTEERFHNTGVAVDPETLNIRDAGRLAVTGLMKDRGAFKVPTLRNIALTAPYMHNGSMKTLEEAVDFYFQGGRPNPQLSGVMPHAPLHNIPLAGQPQAKADLVEFMKALTGEMPELASPPGNETGHD